MSTDLRQMALDTVLEFDKNGQKLDAIVHEKLNQHRELEPSLKKFYIRLVQGTVENLFRLDHMIEAYSQTPKKKIRPAILWILRLSAYQIAEMDGTPASAVVNEAVKMTEKRGFGRLKGYVNAVLRNMIRYPEKVTWPKEDDPVFFLHIIYSVPVYLAEKMMDAYGFEEAKRIAAAFLQDRPAAVHIKTTGNDVRKTVRSMEEDGARMTAAPWPENAYYLSKISDLRSLGSFRKGEFFVQDISSQLVCCAAGIKPGDQILDLCAAPGGKSLLAADFLNGTGKVAARDISASRVRTLQENINRMGFSNIEAEQRDALDFDEAAKNHYDIVLVDAPCSGYGVIGKKPDIKYSASAQKEEELAALQKEILQNAAAYVKPGGTLIYSTCTVSEKENEQNAAWFLQKHPDFSPLSLEKRLPQAITCTGNLIQLLPDNFHDGFFIAAFQKTNTKEPSLLC